MNQPTLSVIVITRNEARNISRCIESIIREVPRHACAEILLVDSASTDETLEIAKRYSINILRLKNSWFLSAAAGRHIGTYYSRGNWLLFLDGDMELVGGWLEKALSHTQNPMIAGISGNIRDIYVQNERKIGTHDHFQNPEGGIVAATEFGGAALYSRFALEQVGGFNPFIKSDEEPELCLRIRLAGYKLIRLPDLMAMHYCIPPKSFIGQIRRARLNYFVGFGQISRMYWGTPLFWVYQKERGHFWPYLIGLWITITMLLLSWIFKDPIFLTTWLAMMLITLIAFILKKGNLKEALQALMFRGLITYGAVKGFFIRPLAPENYPKDIEIVKRAFHLGGLD